MLISPSESHSILPSAELGTPVYHYEKTFDAKHNHYVNASNQYKESGTRTVPQERRE